MYIQYALLLLISEPAKLTETPTKTLFHRTKLKPMNNDVLSFDKSIAVTHYNRMFPNETFGHSICVFFI